jgi:hypothetical protein
MTQESEPADEGWLQIRAGVSLIVWSGLARFDAENLKFKPVDVRDFESDAGHCKVHREFGRLICWIAFSVGAEYLAKGACLLKGRILTKSIPVIRAPGSDEDLEVWSKDVNAGHAWDEEKGLSLGTLAQTPIQSIETLGHQSNVVSAARVSAAIKFLANTIRNRDAHRYERDVRAAHFQAVPRLFVPAFNALLRCLDQPELRHRLKDNGSA